MSENTTITIHEDAAVLVGSSVAAPRLLRGCVLC